MADQKVVKLTFFMSIVLNNSIFSTHTFTDCGRCILQMSSQKWPLHMYVWSVPPFSATSHVINGGFIRFFLSHWNDLFQNNKTMVSNVCEMCVCVCLSVQFFFMYYSTYTCARWYTVNFVVHSSLSSTIICIKTRRTMKLILCISVVHPFIAFIRRIHIIHNANGAYAAIREIFAHQKGNQMNAKANKEKKML